MTLENGLSIGVDVGGTNTDAVVLDAAGTVLASTKQPTADDVVEGIRASIGTVLDDIGERRSQVTRVMLGTTHATNAIVARRGLAKVAAIRLGAPAGTEWPPLAGWPADLSAEILAGSVMLGGGHMVDGTPITRLDRDGLRRFLDETAGHCDAIAVTGIFSPSFPEQEREVDAIIRAHLGRDAPIFLSQDIGPTGLIERENATVLNAALHRVAHDVTHALLAVVEEQRLDAVTFFAQNDGTLMSLDVAEMFPVLTIGSGPANSIRGAAYLSGASDAIVVDVGGTTSDLGVVANGFPRESTLPREIGGVQTNFRMPDILSLSIGGGTLVDVATGRVGPGSVGHRINREGLLFGGSTATLTDAASLHGSPVAGRRLPKLDGATAAALEASLAIVADRLEEAGESLSLGLMELPLVVVGGGGFLVPDGLNIAGDVLRPAYGDVANAVGAAISLAGGRAEHIAHIEERAEGIEAASEAAIAKAIQAGADPLRVEVVEVLETPISYTSHPTVSISAKAAGPLSHLGGAVPSPA